MKSAMEAGGDSVFTDRLRPKNQSLNRLLNLNSNLDYSIREKL